MPKLSPAALRALPRRGRLQRAIRRALHGCGKLVTSELMDWCYGDCPHPFWRRQNIWRSARRFAERTGKRGRETLWCVKDECSEG
jgi:hypothetical protein